MEPPRGPAACACGAGAHPTSRRQPAGPCLLVTLAGCGDDTSSPPTPSSQTPLQAEPVFLLSLAPVPSFSVGLADGPDEYLFTRIAEPVPQLAEENPP